MIQYRTLGKSDLKVSSIGMGCVTFGREIDLPTSFEVMDHALEQGITLFDTAEAYAGGASETVLGQWMTQRKVRDQIVLATKVSGTLTRQRVIFSVEESLKRLQTDRIDLFQLHIWDDQTPLEETLEALTTLVELGKIRSIGCSNWSAWHICKALILIQQQGLARLESVQPPYNLVQREIEADMLPLCADQGVGVISYSPLAAGFLTGKYRRGQETPKGTRFDVIPGHQPIYFTNHGYDTLQKLETLAAQTGRSMVQLALAWVLGQANITSVLIGARNTAQIDQALEAAEAKAIWE
ncbi:MAG: aldo/keto reductase [Planctomycetes bacterium]|nr:aldo/keto reductase [Planctomycetota bacterium]MCH9726012.1 aldo/keto reductase [Planctomycetota bacterium]MCH9777164.1 aldo/keto reductase [Planctomycetota bacterium]MCH9790854.1 aldo/keto reductase [Planctomycetota bacterium]